VQSPEVDALFRKIIDRLHESQTKRRIDMPMSPSGYLIEARKGLNYVKSKIDIGSDNKFSDMLVKLCLPRLAVREVRAQEDKYLEAGCIKPADWNRADWMNYGLEYIRAFALAAIGIGAGNCQELAAIAFMYFYDRDVLPVDYVMIPGRHAFCVIGAPVVPCTNNFTDWSTGTATVCDPWEGRAEFACHLPRRYPVDFRRARSFYRVEPDVQ
jgi:hypothetical protein